MRAYRLASAVAVVALAAITSPADAQTTAGAGTVVVLPLAASIPAAYTSTVFVRNPNPFTITINVDYYLSDSATPAPPGGTPNTPYCPNANSQITIAANASITFDPAVQCGFPASNIFGMIVLEDAAATKTNTFIAYSRTEQPSGGAGPGNGFSVEGFPAGNFSSASSDSLGLKSTSAAPHYRSNCFVGALGEAVNYQIRLFQGETNLPIGGQITGTLFPWHTVRILDVFAVALGVPVGTAGNFANVRATISNSANSAMIGFCTLETSDNGSADFRVAKSIDARDVRQSRVACYGQDDCGTASVNNAAQITDVATKNIHYTIFDQPDYVQCSLVSPNLNGLEIMLRGPGAVQGNTPYPTSPPYSSGGVGATSFYFYTGDKSTISNGATTRWYIDVSYRQGSGVALPISYGVTCQSGNGITVPWLGTTGPANP
jgi:hypothetical protein